MLSHIVARMKSHIHGHDIKIHPWCFWGMTWTLKPYREIFQGGFLFFFFFFGTKYQPSTCTFLLHMALTTSSCSHGEHSNSIHTKYTALHSLFALFLHFPTNYVFLSLSEQAVHVEPWCLRSKGKLQWEALCYPCCWPSAEYPTAQAGP